MLRNIGAVIVGMIVGMIWNQVLVTLNSTVLFPMPEGTSMNDPEQAKAYIATLPVMGFLVVLAAHVGQGGIRGWIAARIGGSRPMLLAGIVGGLTVLGAIAVQLMLDGPVWMWIDVPLIAIAAWFAGNVESKRRAALG